MVFFHRASGTALVCDLIQRFDPATCDRAGGVRDAPRGLVGADGMTPLEWRASFVRAWCGPRRAGAGPRWEPERLVIAHGMLPDENGRAALARGLRWLG